MQRYILLGALFAFEACNSGKDSGASDTDADTDTDTDTDADADADADTDTDADGDTSGHILIDDILVEGDGSNPAHVPFEAQTDANVRNAPACLSPDGTKVAFVATDQNRMYTVYVMNVDGSGLLALMDVRKTLGDDVEYTRACFSPDGENVLFSAKNGLYTISADGGTPEELVTVAGATFLYPTYSPDGSKIAWIDAPANTGFVQVQSSDFSGSPINIGAAYNDVSFSPDGSKVAISRMISDPTTMFAVYALNTDGSGETRISPDTISANGCAYSPNGSLIAMAGADMDADGRRYGIFTTSADGSNLAILFDTKTSGYPNSYYHLTWSGM